MDSIYTGIFCLLNGPLEFPNILASYNEFDPFYFLTSVI